MYNHITYVEYDPELNAFLDPDFGNIILDIYRILKPIYVDLFRETGQASFVVAPNEIVEIVTLEEMEDET